MFLKVLLADIVVGVLVIYHVTPEGSLATWRPPARESRPPTQTLTFNSRRGSIAGLGDRSD